MCMCGRCAGHPIGSILLSGNKDRLLLNSRCSFNRYWAFSIYRLYLLYLHAVYITIVENSVENVKNPVVVGKSFLKFRKKINDSDFMYPYPEYM
mgnify:CR=1